MTLEKCGLLEVLRTVPDQYNALYVHLLEVMVRPYGHDRATSSTWKPKADFYEISASFFYLANVFVSLYVHYRLSTGVNITVNTISSMLYSFFRVIPRRLNFLCGRFGTLCSIFTGRF
jgi:hypothetical protein